MRQLVGTLVLFFLISCAAATEALDGDRAAAAEDGDVDTVAAITLAEITVEGTAEVIDLDLPLAELCDEGKTCEEDAAALADAKVALAAPFFEVRAMTARDEGSASTMLAVRTADGWRVVPDSFVTAYEDDPGCPSIERERAITEVRVEAGALVVVTASDRAWFGASSEPSTSTDDGATLELSKARACRETDDGEMQCGEPAVVGAKLMHDASANPSATGFATTYWVDADGEIETEQAYDDDAWDDRAPGT